MENLRTRILQTALILLVFAIGGCEDESNSTQSEINQITEDMTSGTWKITEFIDSGDDDTSDFTGYLFTFNSSGSLVATKGSTTYTGNWSVTEDSGDDSPDDLDFNIFFNLTNQFEDLNDDWDIVTHTSTKIQLIDVSGGNGGTDNLTFEKN
ncbi:hypothetical protein [Algoriphagus lacus]|nr:hypothetical protein [Algoriphagus lacus]